MTYDQIIGDLKKKIYSPVYFLQGEEPFYIDQIASYIENEVLSESEKEFNQTVLYGKDLDLPTLISYAKRYPMMANYQVVIVKEAQDIRGLAGKKDDDVPSAKKGGKSETKDPFLEYLQKPTPTTILVFCYKYKTIDKRTKAAKTLDKAGIVFESKRIYPDKVPAWVNQYVLSKGHRINPKAAVLMAEYLGADLSRVANEVNKLLLNLKAGDEISAKLVEENIGISKEFNIFELQNALGKRNILKANQIVNYFSANPKANPIQFTLPQLYGYFLKILLLHSISDRSQNNVASILGVHPYFVQDYESAAKAYSRDHCIRNISYIRDYDLRAKGIKASSANDGMLMKELVYRILH
ncbi:MAG: DNA polymerase III subunit delta [Bacteroidetes bacterium]|nr:DNA polymerase III subunit delta [Bacteroidota bacterium]MBK9525899.1 DNA polymerase III subunit delta [Bacteroidota bacterium]MBL0258173.1 DNA polymerase III subunit delta [Bacteroidota bacterium]